jgi:iron complex outermembrane receptor protein
MTLASSLAAWGAPAPVPQPGAPPSEAASQGVTLSEIVVTARRRSENLQQTPLVVNAVTAEALQKLKIQQFQDVQSVVPGLTLQQGSSGIEAAASLRGVTFNVKTGARPTVAMYLNDAPVQANFLFQSLFDVGQIEVLRGPQGTTRGVAAPSGAITLTTRKPSLSEFGGYVDLTATDLQGRIAQGALNVPLVQDKLALRLAGLIDQNDYDGVRSLRNALRPRQATTAARVTLTFQPNERVSGTLAYQHLDRELTSFQQVVGPGDGTALHPPLDAGQRVGVTDGANTMRQHTDVVTGEIEGEFNGRRVVYVGSYQRFKVGNRTPQDLGDVLPGIEPFQTQDARQEITTQELRLASDSAPGRLLDYTVGGFYQWSQNSGLVQQVGAYLPGAFGPPGSFSPAAFDPRYQAPILINVPASSLEASIFGSVTLHIGDKTELSGGARHIFAMQKDSTSLASGTGLIALPASGPCPAGQTPSPYPGFCDLPTPALPIQSLSNRTDDRPNIYNVSVSRRLTPDLMIYANTGTAWRPGPTAVGVLNASNDPVLNALTFLQPESSRAYEMGLKSTFAEGRARLNVAVWRQNFHNLIVYVPNVPYLSSSLPGLYSVSTFSFTANADAVVGGVDLDAAFQITPDWNVAFQYSYAGGHVEKGSRLPCNDADFNGVPDQGQVTSVSQFPHDANGRPTELVALCPGGSATRNPLWNATLQTEYARPVAGGVDGFLRGLLTYYPKNNRAEPAFVVDNYSLVNLYAGLRSHDGAWEVSLFARNAFGTDQLLDRGVQFETVGPLGAFFPAQNVGFYNVATTTARREVGVNVHYAWGSR